MSAIKGAIIIPDQQVDEDNSCVITGLLTGPDHTQESPQPVPSSNVTTATLTLYDQDGNIIGAADRDVSGGFDASGNFRYVLTAADNAIVSSTASQYEDHLAKLEVGFTVSSETHAIKKNIRIRVLKLNQT